MNINTMTTETQAARMVTSPEVPTQESQAYRALVARTRRENLVVAYRMGLNVDPAEVWKAFNVEARIAGN